MKKRRYQKPLVIDGKRVRRINLPSCVSKDIYREVDKVARQFGVSRSWVIAFILGRNLHVEVESYLVNTIVNIRRVK